VPLRFVGQPFVEDAQIGRVLRDALNDDRLTSLWIATAWAKRSGLSRIRSAVTEFTERGGASQVIVGIDEGGATREGLELCLELFQDSFVYHDPGTRTFHPKLYAVEGPDRAVIAIGSGNLTRGGLFTNYEAALVLEAAREDEADWRIRDDARAYFDRLLEGGDAIKPLDAGLIGLLEADGWVTSEARQNARRSAESRQRRQRQALFGAAVGGLAGAPAPELPALPDEEEDEDSVLVPPAATTATAPPAAPQPAPAAAVAAPATVLASWDKVMRPADAQHPERPQTKRTGRLGLGQAGHDIDHRTWFRNVLFGTANWAWTTDRNGNDIELATVPFDVLIAGSSHGTVNLKLDHAEHRESTRGSVLTILHWGELAPVLRGTDYTGRTVTLSHMSDGSYRLEIA
jgi:HKD family nuclease